MIGFFSGGGNFPPGEMATRADGFRRIRPLIGSDPRSDPFDQIHRHCGVGGPALPSGRLEPMRSRPRPHHPVPPTPSSAFAGYRFAPEVITLAFRWYLRFGLSYRDDGRSATRVAGAFTELVLAI